MDEDSQNEESTKIVYEKGGEKKEYNLKVTIPSLLYGLLLVANIIFFKIFWWTKTLLTIEIILGIIIGTECYFIAKRDKRDPVGIAFIGFLFGFLGLIYVLLTSKIKRFELINKISNSNMKNFFEQKKTQKILVVVLLLAIIFLGTFIRIQNVPLLKDSTTGEAIPLALDPFYFLRVAEAMISDEGLPAYDNMRYPSLKLAFNDQMMSKAIILIYKVGKVFNGELTLRFADVISPVVLFLLGLIVFFFFIKNLTKSNSIALLSSGFLALIPSYLYRTMAGFADHEAIGMLGFFACLLISTLALNSLEKKENTKKTYLLGGLLGLFSVFTMFGWAGVAKFIFMIIPAAFLVFWLLKVQKKEKEIMNNTIKFYASWIFSTIVFGMIFGMALSKILAKYLLNSQGVLSVFVLVFMILDYGLMKYSKIKEKRQLYAFGIIILIGIIFSIIKGNNPLASIGNVWNNLLYPFAQGRVSSTVAENASPYLTNWISQTGKSFFWMFIVGVIFVGAELSKKVSGKKEKILFSLFWVLMIFGIIFSRISADSALNGTNFISQAIYFIGLLLFLGYSLKLYLNKKFGIKPGMILIASWMFFMIVFTRSAIRFFFLITPLVCFSVAFFVVKSFKYFKKSKDEILRIFLVCILILALVGTMFNLIYFYQSSKYQASVTGPSADYQWQNAMSWVRENTAENSIFVHWWDYGYWVQTLGERATITDGGHANGFWDHLIGRYILTTTNPASALSFMKAHNVSYLLIDQTDFGKYPAYSKIGSNENYDRFSSLNVLISEKSDIQETSSGTTRIYQGGLGVDEDVVYNYNGTEIFVPGPTYDAQGNPEYKAYVGGVILKIDNSNEINSANVVYFYNNQQIYVPIKYIYFNNELVDLGGGLDATFRIFPRFYQSTNGQYEIDSAGSGAFLSPKVSKSLFAQLYLMNDPLNQYSSLKLVHSEDNYIVTDLRNQGGLLNEFVYYQGLQGPIKIWEVQDNSQIIAREEFLRASGDYAEFDDLKFSK